MKQPPYAPDRSKRTHRIASLTVYLLVILAAYQWGGLDLARRAGFLFLIPTGIIWFADSLRLDAGDHRPSRGWSFFPIPHQGTIRFIGWFVLAGVPATIWLFHATGS